MSAADTDRTATLRRLEDEIYYLLAGFPEARFLTETPVPFWPKLLKEAGFDRDIYALTKAEEFAVRWFEAFGTVPEPERNGPPRVTTEGEEPHGT